MWEYDCLKKSNDRVNEPLNPYSNVEDVYSLIYDDEDIEFKNSVLKDNESNNMFCILFSVFLCISYLLFVIIVIFLST